jgi:hypothetical protein
MKRFLPAANAPRLLPSCATILAALALGAAAGAADSATAAGVLPSAVFVPYEKVPDTALGNQGVFLPYADFLRLWDAANPAPPAPVAPPVPAALTGYTLTGAVAGDAAQLALDGGAAGLAKGWSEIALPGDLALTAFAARDPRVVLRRDGDHLALSLPEAGNYAFSATIAAPVTREPSGRRTVVLALPGGPAGRLDLLIPDAQAEVALSPAVAATTEPAAGGTRLRCVLGGARQVAVSWQPPVQAVGGDALVLATVDVQVTVGERSLRYDAAIGLDILRRGLSDIAVALPAGTQVLAVEAPGLRTWEKTGPEGAEQVVMHLQEPAQGAWKAILRCERLLPALAVGDARTLTVPWPGVVGAARTTGSVAVVDVDAGNGDGLAVTVGAHEGLSQVDPATLGLTAAIAGYRFLAPPPPAELTVVRRAPEVRAAVHQLVRLGSDEDLVTAVVQLDVRQAGLFSLRLTAPSAWELVDTGGLALDDTRAGAVDAAGMRAWELVFRNRLIGAGTVTLRFHAPPSIPHAASASATGAAPVALASLPVLHPEGCRQLRGSLLVAAPRSWALTTTARSGLTGAEAEPLRREGPLAAAARELGDDEDLPLGFTFVAADPAAPAPAVTLGASARARELSLRQEDLVTVAEGNLRRAVTWHGEVRYSALAALRVQAPTVLDDALAFKGAGLAEHAVVARANGVSTWELRFQAPVIGAFAVGAEYVQPLPPLAAGGASATVAVATLVAPDATRTQVLVAVAREGSLEIGAGAAGMDGMAPADLPPGLQGPGVVAGFQGAAPAPLELSLVRRDLVALADAAVVAAHWQAVVGDDAVARVRGDLVLASRGRPVLEIHLPAGATLQEVAVDRRQGRPARRADGTVVVPLGDSAGGTHLVALVYEQPAAAGPLGSFGSVALALPRLGDAGGDGGAGAGPGRPLPVEAVACEVWLPAWAEPWRDAGDLRAPAGVSAWAAVLAALGLPAATEVVPAGAVDDDGLTVAVPVAGVPYHFSRLGDGGTVGMAYVARGWLDALALALATGGLVLWFRASPKRTWRRQVLALVGGLGVLGTSGALAVPAAGLALGVAAGAAVSVGLRVLQVFRRTPPADPWAGLEGDLGNPQVTGNAAAMPASAGTSTTGAQVTAEAQATAQPESAAHAPPASPAASAPTSGEPSPPAAAPPSPDAPPATGAQPDQSGPDAEPRP